MISCFIYIREFYEGLGNVSYWCVRFGDGGVGYGGFGRVGFGGICFGDVLVLD